MASDHLEAELARLVGEIGTLVRREAGVRPVVHSAGPAVERRAVHPGGTGGEAERLQAALEATANRLAQAAARFERLGLAAAAATVRVVERDAREALRELRADRDEGREG